MLDHLFDKINEFLELRTSRKLQLKQCRNCEILSNLLENERRERFKLLDLIKPSPELESQSEKEYQPIKTQTSWAVKRNQLEKESQERARKDA